MTKISYHVQFWGVHQSHKDGWYEYGSYSRPYPEQAMALVENIKEYFGTGGRVRVLKRSISIIRNGKRVIRQIDEELVSPSQKIPKIAKKA